MTTLLSTSPEEFIPFFAIFFTFMVPILGMYFYYQNKNKIMDERKLMIEKGLTPPPLKEHSIGNENYQSKNAFTKGLNLIAIAYLPFWLGLTKNTAFVLSSSCNISGLGAGNEILTELASFLARRPVRWRPFCARRPSASECRVANTSPTALRQAFRAGQTTISHFNFHTFQ